jgi:hypothetical protein
MRTGHGKMITRRGVMEFGIGGDQSACGVYVPSEEWKSSCRPGMAILVQGWKMSMEDGGINMRFCVGWHLEEGADAIFCGVV